MAEKKDTRKQKVVYESYHQVADQVTSDGEFDVILNSLHVLQFKIDPKKVWQLFMTLHLRRTLEQQGFLGAAIVNADRTVALEPRLDTAAEREQWKTFEESTDVAKQIEAISAQAQEMADHFIRYAIDPIQRGVTRLVSESVLAASITTAKEEGGRLKSTDDLLEWVDVSQREEKKAIRDRVLLPDPGRPAQVTRQRLLQAIDARRSQGKPSLIKALATDMNEKESTVRKALDRYGIEYEGVE